MVLAASKRTILVLFSVVTGALAAETRAAEFSPGDTVLLRGTQTLRSDNRNFLSGHTSNIRSYTSDNTVATIGNTIRRFRSGNVAYEVIIKDGDMEIRGFILRNRHSRHLMQPAETGALTQAGFQPARATPTRSYVPTSVPRQETRESEAAASQTEAHRGFGRTSTPQPIGRTVSRASSYVYVNMNNYNLRGRTQSGGLDFRDSTRSNVVGSADRGEIYPVLEVRELSRGNALKISAGPPEKWIYDSRSTSSDILYCEDQNCSNLAAGFARSIARMNRSSEHCANCESPQTRAMSRAAHVPETGLSLPRLPGQCSQFIDSGGRIGPWGEQVLGAINRVAPSCFYENMYVGAACPNYRSFSSDRAKKEAFWVFVFAAIAEDESTCRPNARARAVNGIADGMLQMEYSYSQRRRAGRNRRWCRTGGPTNSQDLTFQFECAASIIEDVHCKYGRPLNYGGGYWQKLRYNRSVMQRIRSFPGC